MLEVQSSNGEVKIKKMDGTENRLINDIGALVHKTLLLISNYGATTAGEVYLKYGILARQLVDYIEVTISRINELEN